ncbi:C-type lectin domain family 18 member A-like isoform X2 [Mytilus trossulus]|uniref:C-type lectin domain family 18 member A-like isoform X2 n=1 Tax=Mytilus trossulus TaxID=6551 RepID=UPI003004D47D
MEARLGVFLLLLVTVLLAVVESGYIGCYQDDRTRILPKAVLKDKGMTVKKCQQFCGKKGFKFAGVEYGYECFCGNVLRKCRKRKESDCKTPCSGNKRQTCGGPWRISIYTGKPSNCKGKCHKNGICKQGRCRCKRGYTGDGITTCSICPLGWKSYGFSCYFFSQTTATWNNAKKKCITKNSMLAEVVSYGERDFLRKRASEYAETFWIGGTDSKHEGIWIWATSQRNVIVTGWHTRRVKEPNNQGGNEHCINIHKKLDFEWNDDRCWNSYRYICEKLLV